MADTNTYDLFQKVEKWTTKEKFNALGNLTEIETGTEYNLTGPIDETDLDSDLQTKINGKLTAPTTPTADSAITMLADGTVGTKPLSEIGGKLYFHSIEFIDKNNQYFCISTLLPLSSNVTLENYLSIFPVGYRFVVLVNSFCGSGRAPMPISKVNIVQNVSGGKAISISYYTQYTPTFSEGTYEFDYNNVNIIRDTVIEV